MIMSVEAYVVIALITGNIIFGAIFYLISKRKDKIE